MAFFYGMLIGIANVIPGLSGSTVAVCLGVYDQLLNILRIFFIPKRWKELFPFLPLVLGIFFGIFLFSKVYVFLENFSLSGYMLVFFTSVILVTLPSFYYKDQDSKKTEVGWLFFIFGIFLIVMLAFFLDLSKMTTFFFNPFLSMYMAGFLGSVAMIIPGLSGSLLLLWLGLYDDVVSAVSSLQFSFLFWIMLGALSGLGLFSNLFTFFWAKWPLKFNRFIMGLVVGTVPLIWPGFYNGKALFFQFIIFILGSGLSYFFLKLKSKT